MNKMLQLTLLRRCRARRFLALTVTLVLLGSALPCFRSRVSATGPDPITKLSFALQQALNSNESFVWQDPSRQTVRTLIQTVGPVSPNLTATLLASGGLVVRQFTSINGLLVDLPKSRLLAIAARADVERMSADHLAQQSASHLEVSTGADRVRTYNPLLQTYSGLDENFAIEPRPGQYARVKMGFAVAEYLSDGMTIDELLRQAVVATRQRKSTGKLVEIVRDHAETRLAS